MTNKYNIVIANPANNITAFVLDDVDKSKYSDISKKILQKDDYKIEQVGFIKKPKTNADIRLEMMGGEFCGNASRSIGLIFAKENNIIDRDILVEVTGSNEVLKVSVDLNKGIASIEMPIPKSIEYIEIKELGIFPMVIIDGIFHVIAENLEATDKNFNYFKDYIVNKYQIEAFGVMFFKRDKNYITPVVYVRDTDTVFFESSCGSGTLATAYYLSKDLEGDNFEYSIKQPGGIIESKVHKKNNKVESITIGGSVELSKCITIEL